MKKLTLIILATMLVGTWLVPSQVQAQPRRGFFNRLFGGGQSIPYSGTDTQDGTHRIYSYEPSAEPSYRVRTYGSRGATKSPWMYPKSDPRRYDARF